MNYFYKVELKTNDETFTKKGFDLEETLMKLKPKFIHTQSFVTITYKRRVFDRMLNLIDSRRLFSDKTYREIFINNLI